MTQCQCEHIAHLETSDMPRFHEYGAAPATALRCWFVGPVCVSCYLYHLPGMHLPLTKTAFEEYGGMLAVLIDLPICREFQYFLPQTNKFLEVAHKRARSQMAHGVQEVHMAFRLQAIEMIQKFRAAMLQ